MALLGASHASQAETVCECATPPGGRVTCPDGNLAICVVKGGKAETKCIPIPEDIQKDETGRKMSFFVFKKVTGLNVTEREIADDDKLSNLMKMVLKEMKYTKGDVVITFKFKART
jgi:hypothetical protein